MRFILSIVSGIIVTLFVYYYTTSRLTGSPVEALNVELHDLLARQNDYEGRRVRVQGIVGGNAGMLGVGAYRLWSGASQVFVVSIGGIPAMGSPVIVQGTFRQAFSMNDMAYSVILEE